MTALPPENPFEKAPDDLGQGPRVSVPERPWVLWAGVAGAVGLGAIVFTTLLAGQNRQMDSGDLTAPLPPAPGRTGDGQAQAEPPPAPDLFAPPPQMALAQPEPVPVYTPPAPPPPPVPVYTPPPIPAEPLPEEQQPQSQSSLSQRLRSPALVVDMTNPPGPGASVPEGGAAPGSTATGVDANDAFAARLSTSDTQAVRATQISDMSTFVPQGVMIAAVLETAINSDLPGFVRAVVSRDITGFDGSKVLIPRGSRLVGQYRSELAIGQKRTFVVWSRLIRPDGVSIQLSSPGTDPLGRAGLEGRVNRHLLERFGPGLLLTAVNAALSSNNQPNTQLIIGSATQAAPGLTEGQNIKPTVTIAQGAAIQVFVARDLDFSGVPPVAPLKAAAR